VASPLRILHITDPHLHASREARMRGVNTDDTLVATLAHALASARRPDLVLATGDLVQDETRAGYERFQELLGALGLPVYCLPGNHDDPALMREVLAAAPFQFCGTATHGAWSLVMLNSYAKGDDGGLLAAEDLDLLERTLARAASAHYLIALHHQPVPMGSQWLDTVPLRNADEFLTLCDRHPRIRGIVWGHVHQASERERRGVKLLSTPSTCAQFTPGSDRFALDTRPPGYRWIDLHEDGRIDTSVVWVE
jgi:3',5'-cyclic-AMP phosphodiesterase